jgi:hypothetical protein
MSPDRQSKPLAAFKLSEQTGDFMTADSSIARTQEYNGCGIRAASYKVGPRDWVPEACFWVHSKNGWTRMWVNSFAHVFDVQDQTFANESDADACAFRLARRLIDKTLPDLNLPIWRNGGMRAAYLSRILQIARRSLSAYSQRLKTP